MNLNSTCNYLWAYSLWMPYSWFFFLSFHCFRLTAFDYFWFDFSWLNYFEAISDWKIEYFVLKHQWSAIIFCRLKFVFDSLVSFERKKKKTTKVNMLMHKENSIINESTHWCCAIMYQFLSLSSVNWIIHCDWKRNPHRDILKANKPPSGQTVWNAIDSKRKKKLLNPVLILTQKH